MKIAIIGAGNVGTHLAKALHASGATITQIVSRTMKSAVELASEFGCSFATDLQDVDPNADLYVLCVPDSAIAPVLQGMRIGSKLIVHTSGSVGIEVFNGLATNYGCLYPLQTFSKFKDLNYSNIPVFIEANSDENQQILIDLMKKITPHVESMTSKQREILHLCGVLVNNFPNHLCALAESLMKENNLQFDVLKPLMRETFEKMLTYSPYMAQTGPAVRKDEGIIRKHQTLLQDNKNLLEIYTVLSNSILDMYSEKQ